MSKRTIWGLRDEQRAALRLCIASHRECLELDLAEIFVSRKCSSRLKLRFDRIGESGVYTMTSESGETVVVV